MKIAIISDVHANLAALRTFPEKCCDQIWCLGDLVDYGPRPEEVIQWVKERCSVLVRGNHDNAVGFGVDPQCSEPFKRLAFETMAYSRSVCPEEDFKYLRDLPVQREMTVGSTRFYLVHAMPSSPLFGYCAEKSERWKEETILIDADVLLVGHTHTPFIRKIGKTTIVNPGSLGQPKTGRPLACYAVWEDGDVSLREYAYPLEETIRDIHRMPISQEDQNALVAVLKTGALPQ